MASTLDLIALKMDNELQKYTAECVQSDIFSGMTESEKQCVAFELHDELSRAGLLELWSNFMQSVYKTNSLEDACYADYIDWQKVDEILYRADKSSTTAAESDDFVIFDYDA